MFTLKLLGNPHIDTSGGRIEPPASKLLALLYYLAYTGEWVSRDTLTLLFWPDDEAKPARAKLRQLINRSRKLSYAAALEVDPGRLRWQVATDVTAFKEACRKQNWTEAVAYYDGLLLQPFILRDAPGFEAWLELERSDLHLSWREAALRAAQDLAKTDRHSDASTLLRRVWRLSDYDEEALQAYMQSAYSAGHKEAALQAFQTFEKQLAAEFGVEPTRKSLDLVAAIKQDAVVTTKAAAVPRQTPTLDLPDLIGRDRELTELSALLGKKDGRFLALTGLGGVGKTRLALELAERHVMDFEHGTFLVELAGVSDPERMVGAVAGALGFSFYGTKDPADQLADYLRDKHLLLLVDNLEHLLAGAAILSDLLAHAPGLKLLVTSREKPELPETWEYRLTGLAYGDTNAPAARLFIQRALARAPAFDALANQKAIQKVCKLVEGLPLALELAAAWTGDLSVEEIVSEIGANLDFLTRGEGVRDSMRAVLEHSWQLLSPEQQALLARLSVFRGGFTKEAATVVAGANPYLLLSLTNRSLIAKEKGRFTLHELVRSYAGEKLVDKSVVCAAHADYFARYMAARSEELIGPERKRSLLDLKAEAANGWLAWSTSTEHKNERTFRRLLKPLNELAVWQNQFKGLASELERAAEQFDDLRLVAEIYTFLAPVYMRLGKNGEAETLLSDALDRLDEAQDSDLMVRLYNRYGDSLGAAGRPQDAVQQYQRALGLAAKQEDQVHALRGLGRILIDLGKLDEAQRHLKDALAQARAPQSDLLTAEVLGVLAINARRQGAFTEAISYISEALRIYEGLGDDFEQAAAQYNLALVYFRQDAFQKAAELLTRAKATFEELGTLNHLGSALDALGAAYQMLDQPETARHYMQEALALSRKINDTVGTATSLGNLGTLASEAKQYQKAEAYFNEALPLIKQTGQRHKEAQLYVELAKCAYLGTEPKPALPLLQSALAIASDIGDERLAIYVVSHVARVIRDSDSKRCLRYCYFVLNQPMRFKFNDPFSQEMLDLLESDFDPAHLEVLKQTAQVTPLVDLTAEILSSDI